MIQMADVITELNLWEHVRDNPPDEGYAFSTDPNIARIAQHDSLAEHSGASFALTMRHMQCIARDGFERYNEKM